LRGEPQNLDLDVSLVARLFEQVDAVGCLILTGGEPSLVPHIISQIFDIAEEKGTDIQSFYIATNAVQVSNEFLEVLFKAYMKINYDYDGMPLVEVSSDVQHDECCPDPDLRKRNINKLMAFRFVGKRDEGINYEKDGGNIHTGRAEEMYSFGRRSRQTTVNSISISDDEIESNLHLNCKGNILPSCNLSYETQDEEEIVICNVKRKFSLINSIKRYNRKIERNEIMCIGIAA